MDRRKTGFLEEYFYSFKQSRKLLRNTSYRYPVKACRYTGGKYFHTFDSSKISGLGVRNKIKFEPLCPKEVSKLLSKPTPNPSCNPDPSPPQNPSPNPPQNPAPLAPVPIPLSNPALNPLQARTHTHLQPLPQPPSESRSQPRSQTYGACKGTRFCFLRFVKIIFGSLEIIYLHLHLYKKSHLCSG